MKSFFYLLSAACLLTLMGRAAELGNNWTPAYLLQAPFCSATDWNQNGALNAYVGYAPTADGEWKPDATTWKDNACGCDPLAWGQVITYHALNHGFPAAGWEPTPVSGKVDYVVNNNRVELNRTTMSGPYDWVAIRDKRGWVQDANGTTTACPVGRLMWDIGTLGGTIYGWNSSGTVWPRVCDYFGYEGTGYRFSEPFVGTERQAYWGEMLRVLLRTSLQAGAPLTTSIRTNPNTIGSDHMVVTDGYAVDANGKEWFHVDHGWGNSSGKWWDMDQLLAKVHAVYAFVYPTDLGGIVAGRAMLPTGAPVAGATVVLSNGREARVTTTDEMGTYCFVGLETLTTTAEELTDADVPHVSYTVTLLADGCDPATQCVTLTPNIWDDLRAEKQTAYEKATYKNTDYNFPLMIGSALADFTLTPKRYFAAGASGTGRSWASPAALTQAAIDAAAGGELYLAQGTYTLSGALTLPVGTRLWGGFDATSGTCNPLKTPSHLSFTGGWRDQYITLSAGAEIHSVTLSGEADANRALYADSQLAERPLAVGISFDEPLKANNCADYVALVCCTFARDGVPAFENCTYLHCSFFGDGYNDKEGVDLGGNRVKVGSTNWVPGAVLPCLDIDKAGHLCPEAGLDLRPLNQTQGALAPNAAGYTLSLQ